MKGSMSLNKEIPLRVLLRWSLKGEVHFDLKSERVWGDLERRIDFLAHHRGSAL